ncbi:MAG: hypothetical protein J1E41_02635 [Ruminococcus sp.]|nr:hypothetical protein [Ruminococcus sp.]
MIKIKLRANEFFYFTAYFLLCFSAIVYTDSYLSGLFPSGTNSALRYASLLLFLLSLLQNKWRPLEFILWGLIGAAVISAAVLSDRSMLVIYIMAIISGRNIEFEKIKKFVISANIICTLTVLISCFLGLIPNQIYTHVNTDSFTQANSLGFKYYSNLSTIAFLVSTLILSLKNRKFRRWPCILVLLIINFVIYIFATTRLTFILFLFEVVLVVLISKYNVFKIRNNRFWRTIATVAFPFFAGICLWVSYTFSYEVDWMRALNSLLNGRLRFNRQGIFEYGLTPLGQKIEMVGGTDVANSRKQLTYFYIDSGYIYTLLAYGVIVFALLIIGYSLIFRSAVIKGDMGLFVCCSLICIHALINNIFINIALNPFLILVPSILTERSFRKNYLSSKGRRSKRMKLQWNLKKANTDNRYY